MVGDYPPQMICLELGFIWFHADCPDLLARLLRSHPRRNVERPRQALNNFWRKSLPEVNIAMENGPFIDGLPIKHGGFPWQC
jgi:hypothetical protein